MKWVSGKLINRRSEVWGFILISRTWSIRSDSVARDITADGKDRRRVRKTNTHRLAPEAALLLSFRTTAEQYPQRDPLSASPHSSCALATFWYEWPCSIVRGPLDGAPRSWGFWNSNM